MPISEATRRDLLARMRRLPTGPGVYSWRSATGRVLYVGKAANLRARVRSYLRGDPSRPLVRLLV
jgi:excinuclease ABC subunit C